MRGRPAATRGFSRVRRSQLRSRALFACALVPAALMMAIGFAKQFLFEVRYFAATAPLLIVACFCPSFGRQLDGAAGGEDTAA